MSAIPARTAPTSSCPCKLANVGSSTTLEPVRALVFKRQRPVAMVERLHIVHVSILASYQ